jgi:predicted nucleic acid-binding protein
MVTGDLPGVTSVETLQEVLHRYRSLNRLEELQVVFDGIIRSVRRVLPVTVEDLEEARRLGSLLPPPSGVSSRDLVHAAVARRHGFSQLVSFDQGFDLIKGVHRIEP